MKIVRAAVCICVLASALYGCGTQDGNTANVNTEAPVQSNEEFEQAYYDKHKRIEGCELYISPDKDFAVQLPEGADISYTPNESGDGEDNPGLKADIINVGSVTVLTEDNTYTPYTNDELQVIYAADSRAAHTIDDFNIIYDNDNEIGRYYEIETDNEPVVFKKEYKYNDKTLSVLGQPKGDENNEALKTYVDSFELLY